MCGREEKKIENVQVVQYADDISIYATILNIAALTKSINDYVPMYVIEFLNEQELAVSPEKSMKSDSFSPDTKEFKHHPKFMINNFHVLLEYHPKMFGVTYDTMYTML